jgi:hypothetical protein
MAIVLSILWFLVGVVIVGGLIWLVLYVFNKVSGEPVPPKVQMFIWLLFGLICLIIFVMRMWPLVGRYIH